ncbi:MAG: microcin C transport system substrate-binding protein [Oleiphilaceae bacterium]|jgi:microcin C transport system substrate-binding protein
MTCIAKPAFHFLYSKNTQQAIMLLFVIMAAFLSLNSIAKETITESHGFALYGDLKYPENFDHFDYVNPIAPKGGDLRLMGFGSFDSLNPYTLKGMSPFNTPGQFIFGFSELNETLMIGTGDYSPSADEPQSAYGLIAKSIRYPEDIAWIEFTIHTNAHFHDNHPINSEDVVFSYKTLIEKGHPRFQQTLLGVQSVEAINDKVVRFTFKDKHQRANILRAGELPVLPKHFWQEKDFERSSEIIPLLSGPYRVKDFKMGQQLRLERHEDFWAKGLNVYQGRYNFDSVTIDYYRDQSVAFEGFKAGQFDLFYDYTAKNWAMAYDFPAIREGKVTKEEIEHKIPSSSQAFFFNVRRPLFQDKRVREALSLMFDFEWTNKSLFNGAYKRNQSFYPNSDFQALGLPDKEEIALLEPFKGALPKELFTQEFKLPITNADGNIRTQLRQASKLLKEAGWVLKDQQLVHEQTGKAFEFEILMRQAGIQRVLLPFIKNLERLGITAIPRLIDTAQYKVRLDQFDFDMTIVSLSQGHAPSYEQRDYFHTSTSMIEGSQNYAGIHNPVIDSLIEKVLTTQNRNDLVTSMQALDRVLLWEYYTIPNWHLNYHRLASWQKFERPKSTDNFELSPYKLGIENWWAK